MDRDLLEILVCPRTKQKLMIADPDMVKKLNGKIKTGACKDISGEPIVEVITEGLYQPDHKTFYMIRDGIPLLIYDNAIKLD